MKYLILILTVISFRANAQRLLGGVGENLKIKGKVFFITTADRDSTGTPTGGCLFLDHATGEVKLTACGGGGGGSYSAGNGMTLTGSTFSLGDLTVTAPIIFDASSRQNWFFNSVDTILFDALEVLTYRKLSILGNGVTVLGFGTTSGVDESISYNNGTGEFRYYTANGTFPTFWSSNAEAWRSDFNQRMLIGYTSNNGSGQRLQVNGGAYFNGAINIVDGNQTVGWVWTCTDATTGAGEWAAAGGGGGGGNTNSNVGSAFRLAIPGTNDIKTIAAGPWILIDSSTTNQLRFSVDTNAVKARMSLIINDSLNAFRNSLDYTSTKTIETTDAIPVNVDTLYIGSGSDLVTITVEVSCDSKRLDGAGGYNAKKRRTYIYEGGTLDELPNHDLSADEYDTGGNLSTCTFDIISSGNYVIVQWTGQGARDIQSTFNSHATKTVFLP